MLFNLSKVGRRAFTLVELIIVIVIVGILAAISIVGYQSVVDRAEQAAAETTLQSVDREYRALAAFNMAADPSAGVSIADMTVIDGIDYTAGDTDSDGMLEPGETVSFDGVVLTLATATTTGDLSTSAAGDGSSESADPYAGWDSYTHTNGTTYYLRVDWTSGRDVTLTGSFDGLTLDAPIATNTGEILIGGTWVWEYGDLYQQSGMTSQPIVLQTDGTWTLSFTAKDAVYNGMVNWENAGPNIDIGPWSWSPLYWNDGSGNSYAFYFSGMAPSAPSS